MIKALWFHEFGCPVQGGWYYDSDGIVPILKNILSINLQTIISVVTNLAEAKINATKQVARGGWKLKIEAENKGLLFVALSLNRGLLPSMETCICNSNNRDSNTGMAGAYFKRTFQFCWNTLLNELR